MEASLSLEFRHPLLIDSRNERIAVGQILKEVRLEKFWRSQGQDSVPVPQYPTSGDVGSNQLEKCEGHESWERIITVLHQNDWSTSPD